MYCNKKKRIDFERSQFDLITREKVMAQTLISFLGKALDNKNYRSATYQFEENIYETDNFFGMALQKQIRAEKIVILGTDGSMWSVLVEHLSTEDQSAYEDERLALMDAKKVTQDLLDKVKPLVEKHFGVTCHLEIIPYGRTQAEQIQILQSMAKHLDAQDQVSIDVTHGFRHLPMLGLVSAVYLKIARQINVVGLYYGALDMTEDQKTPVLRLDGLLHIVEWIIAIQSFNTNGDYSIFCQLLTLEGVKDEKTDLLKKAAFLERNQDVAGARAPLKKFNQALAEKPFTGVGQLFEAKLKERLAWVEKPDLFQRQHNRAMFYLNNRDYLRAATLGFESFITKNVPQGEDVQNYEIRARAKKSFEESNSKSSEAKKNYDLLRNLRNALAHADRSNIKKIQQARSAEEKMQTLLTELLKSIE